MIQNTFLNFIENFFGSQPILFATTLILILFRAYLLVKFVIFSLSGVDTSTQRSRYYLMAFLGSATLVDSAWLFRLVRDIFIGPMDYRPYLFWLRITWGLLVIEYQVLMLFVETFASQSNKISLRQKCFMAISGLFFIIALTLAIWDINCGSSQDRPYIEFIIRYIETIYIYFILVPINLGGIVWSLWNKPFPLILKKQLKILLIFFIFPLWACDVFESFPFMHTISPSWTLNSYAASALSQILITLCSFYCARKVMSLRFLNLQNHVQSLSQSHFVNHFRNTLEQLGHATDISELKHIAQKFFHESFNVDPTLVSLHVRHEVNAQDSLLLESGSEIFTQTAHIESFIDIDDDQLKHKISSLKVLMYAEIAFTNFYENDTHNTTILNFLDSIHADIFLPIYEDNKMIAYIIVRRHARGNELYSDVDRDEMFIFANYLGHVLNLFKNRNLLTTIHQEKLLKEELYLKHQEINQYKESVRSFLRNHKQQSIGIIFYKHRRFTFGNKAAKDLVPININMQEGHPLSKAIKTIAHQVEEYKETQHGFAFDKDGNRLIIAGVPSLERNDVIIMVYHPGIADLVKKQIENLQDPTTWDYLLYLETTHSGKLINQLIPGSGETLVAFKIQLLKAALSKKALLIMAAQDDLLPTIEIIHHISLRETLRTLKLVAPTKGNTTAITIFGANPIFSMDSKEKPLLEQLNGTGTLHIQNVHFLELEAQNQLAEFIKYGLYRRFKSDQLQTSDVRIICSTNQDLQHLAAEGLFSKALLGELRQTTLSLPSLINLPEAELDNLVDGFTEQSVATHDLKNILSLSDKEKHKLAANRPLSLQEFKQKVQALLIQKSKNNFVHGQAQFDPAAVISDPQLVEAARLGKHALRDPRLMAILWHKFKNQSKIASFLDVNRSSVNRRLKDYGLSN